MEINDLPDNVLPQASDASMAMLLGKRLSITYHGEPRTVEVHAIGLSKKGKPCMRVYQVLGGAVFGEQTGWKMLSLEDVDDVKILDIASEGPRPGYKPGDLGMGTIFSEISNEPVPSETD